MKQGLNGISAPECTHRSECDFCNRSLENRIGEYVGFGAVPHCCFAELIRETAITGLCEGRDGKVNFFASFEAFNEMNPSQTGHCHGSIAWLSEMFARSGSIVLHAKGGLSVEISAPETAKLLTQVRNYLEAGVSSHFEEIEIADGEQMVFSTPEPELPAEFIEYLSAVFSRLHEVSAVYVFDTSRADDNAACLTIGVVPADKIGRSEVDRLSMLIVEGVERFLEEHDQLDFILLEDEELVEIARSVSPPIELQRNR